MPIKKMSASASTSTSTGTVNPVSTPTGPLTKQQKEHQKRVLYWESIEASMEAEQKAKLAGHEEWKEEWKKGNKDYVSRAEQAILASLKEKQPGLCEKFTDKMLYIFLFARKWDTDRTIELLKNFVALCVEYGIDPAAKGMNAKTVNQHLLNSGYAYAEPGAMDYGGRSISYIYLSRYDPKQVNAKDLIAYVVWQLNFTAAREPLNSWRKGVVYIEDLSGAGFKNVGGGNDSKKLMAAMENCIPIRIARIYILNGGFIVRGLLAFARLIMKAKIIQRVYCVTPEDLKIVMDSKYIDKNFGGTGTFNYHNWVQSKIDEANAEEANEQKN